MSNHDKLKIICRVVREAEQLQQEASLLRLGFMNRMLRKNIIF